MNDRLIIRVELDRWAAAISEVVFGADRADRPVYLDMEDAQWAAVGRSVGESGDRACQTLARLVSATLDLRSRTSAFAWWVARARSWRDGDHQVTPPTLPLLTTLSAAAEAMGADQDIAPHNYYLPLCNLLGIDREGRPGTALIDGYRANAEELWQTLNLWLEAYDGARGLPTAETVGAHRYVGLPLSQALVRATDRAALTRMFDWFDLSPGATTSAQDMRVLLEEWIATGQGVTTSLRRMWGRGEAVRHQMAEVAAGELRGWTGRPVGAGEGPQEFRAKLVARIRTFPRRSLELNLLMRRFDGEGPGLSVVGQPDSVLTTTPASGGGALLADPGSVTPDSLLAGEVRLVGSDGGTAVRKPRALVVLVHDPLVQAHVEAERITLGADCILLVATGLASKLEEALRQIARPGWVRTDAMSGLPEGWVAFSGVQVVDVLNGAYPVDFNRLVPLSASQLVLSGGIRLPGISPRWSAAAPPEVRAVHDGSRTLTVRVIELRTEELEWKDSVRGPVAIWSLADAELLAGDYRLELFADAGRGPVARTTVKLRAASASNAAAEVLGYNLDDRLGALTAVTGGEVRGAHLQHASAPRPPGASQPPATLTRAPRPRADDRQPLRLPTPDPTSCFITGAHRLVLPDAGPGARPRALNVHCKSCGLVKRIPPPRRKNAGGAAPSVLDLSALLPTQPEGAIGWDAAFDALCYLRGGPISALERIALQIEPSSLFVDHVVRALEVLGHIDVSRDPHTLRPTSWSVSPTVLATLPDRDRTVVSGFRSDEMEYALHRATRRLGLDITWQEQARGPAALFIETAEPDALAAIERDIEGSASAGAAVVAEAGRRLSEVLPPLYRLVRELPSGPVTGYRSVHAWHVPSASWVPTPTAGSAGFYKVQDRTTTYAIRKASDVEDGLMRIADARIVKHAAAWAHKTAHMAHDGTNLLVPLGADLPALVGRSAVLCSGLLPIELEAERLLVYPDVPADVAARIYEHLTASPGGSS